MTYKFNLVLRKDTETNWLFSTYVPLEGEPCYDITNSILKIGNGIDYFPGLDGISGGGGGVILEDTTIYVETTGSDDDGQGDIESPFATPHKALAFLADKRIADCIVTIQIGVGHFISDKPLVINHSDSQKIIINGAGIKDDAEQPTEVYYTPRDNATPYDIASRKWLCSSKASTNIDDNIEIDYIENKALLFQEYLTVLQFNDCDGIRAEGVSLKELDKVGILGSAFEEAGSSNTWSGISIGHDAWAGPNSLKPKTGGITLGNEKEISKVAIMGFGGGGVAIDGNTSVELGALVIANCYGGISAKSSYVHHTGMTAIRTKDGIYFTSGSNTTWAQINIYGTYNAINIWNGSNLSIKLRSVGCINMLRGENVNMDALIFQDNNCESFDNTNLFPYYSGWAPINVGLSISANSSNSQIDIDNICTNWTVQGQIHLSDSHEDKLEKVPWSTPLNVVNYDGRYVVNAKAGNVKDFFPKIEEATDLASFTPDMAISDYFEYTLTQSATLIAPINAIKGQSGTIVIKQDNSGNRLLSFNSAYIFPSGTPVINTDSNAYNVFKYTVIESNIIFMEFATDFVSQN